MRIPGQLGPRVAGTAQLVQDGVSSRTHRVPIRSQGNEIVEPGNCLALLFERNECVVRSGGQVCVRRHLWHVCPSDDGLAHAGQGRTKEACREKAAQDALGAQVQFVGRNGRGREGKNQRISRGGLKPLFFRALFFESSCARNGIKCDDAHVSLVLAHGSSCCCCD